MNKEAPSFQYFHKLKVNYILHLLLPFSNYHSVGNLPLPHNVSNNKTFDNESHAEGTPSEHFGPKEEPSSPRVSINYHTEGE